MKALPVSLLSLACAVALSACSSGGSHTPPKKSSHTIAPNTNTTAPSNNTTPSTNTTAPSTNTTAPSNNTTNNNTNNNGNNNTKPDTSHLDNANLGANATSFSDAMKKGMVNMERGTFNGTLITINNKTGAIKGGQTANLNFEQFRLGGTKVLLLHSAHDRVESTPLREFKAKDFPDGGFAPKDPKNPGWIGSTYGNQGDVEFVGNGLQSFGRLRFGVYTDNTDTTYMFVHGNPAAPTDVFKDRTFRGSAIIGKDGNYRPLSQAVTAKIDSTLTHVDVSIKTDKTTLNFGGDIDLNNKTFSGTKGGVETRGGLFGEDSIGGFFNVTDGVHKGENGVYGASSGSDVIEAYGK